MPAEVLLVILLVGLRLAKIRRRLNAEGVPGPKGKWSPTGVREILHRRDYKGEIITNRIQRAWDAENQREIRHGHLGVLRLLAL